MHRKGEQGAWFNPIPVQWLGKKNARHYSCWKDKYRRGAAREAYFSNNRWRLLLCPLWGVLLNVKYSLKVFPIGTDKANSMEYETVLRFPEEQRDGTAV